MIVQDKDGNPHEVLSLDPKYPGRQVIRLNTAGICYVVTREYSDGSTYEILRVYTNEERAKLDVELVKGDHGMIYKIHAIQFLTGGV